MPCFREQGAVIRPVAANIAADHEVVLYDNLMSYAGFNWSLRTVCGRPGTDSSIQNRFPAGMPWESILPAALSLPGRAGSSTVE